MYEEILQFKRKIQIPKENHTESNEQVIHQRAMDIPLKIGS